MRVSLAGCVWRARLPGWRGLSGRRRRRRRRVLEARARARFFGCAKRSRGAGGRRRRRTRAPGLRPRCLPVPLRGQRAVLRRRGRGHVPVDEKAWEAAYAKAEERAAIVAWLRSGDGKGGDDAVARTLADAIEAGEHVVCKKA